MGRGRKPAKSNEAKLPVVRKSPKDDGAQVRDLEKRLAESLEREKAAGEILRVISSSPASVQPTFEAIARAAMSLCEADIGSLFRFDGQLIHVGAFHGTPEETEASRRAFPQRPSHGSVTARAILAATVVQIDDVSKDPEAADALRAFRTVLSVPMIRDERPLGAITVARRVVRPFSDEQIKLLQTFADQAVIAIENVRLFNETKEALERQTATSEILRVISSSPTDVQPVYDAIVRSAVTLCGATLATVYRREKDLVYLVGIQHEHPHAAEVAAAYPAPLTSSLMSCRAILANAVIHLPDVEADGALPPEGLRLARLSGFRSVVSIPLRRDGISIGAILVGRPALGLFPDEQVALLQTFADQAVIAIENVRLFKELQEKNGALTQAHAQVTEALEQQTATSEILRVISSAHTDAQPVFDSIVRSAARLLGGHSATLTRVVGDELQLAAQTSISEAADAETRASFPNPLTQSPLAAHTLQTRRPYIVADVETDPLVTPRLRYRARLRGFRSVLVVPMVRREHTIGFIGVTRQAPGGYSEDEIALLKTFADQAVIAIENVRLFRELEAANRDLEAASRHKSEFLANMSHELRTPLNAIIGFSEVLSERMFGELNEKQEEYSKDIHASGQHLLSLINDILDLSKIEAGRMELELSDFHLPTALDSALTLVRERAGRRGIALQINVDERLGEIQADERKVRQVVLNLLSNAIKFTPEGGRIEVRAEPRDGFVEVSVTDTGVGIAPEDQEAVFEEFRQVGTADKKVEGTGLGLTLCRKFVELHGGRIWVESQLGVGSTFTFTIPVRRGQ